MNGRLAGKTAFITAAGQGIGRATALAMAAEGAQVHATDVNPKFVAALAGTANITSSVLDVLDDAAVEKTIAGLPRLDVLFNCAGFVHNGTILDCTPKDWEFSFNLNVRAMYVAIRAALPKMLEKGGGSIINMASIASSIKGLPNRFVYGASKAAVVGLTKAVAADFVTRGIRCNAIAPGTVDTPSLGGSHRRVRGSGRGAQGVHRAPADGTTREGRGDRAAGRVSRLRRIRLRDRQCVFGRRRHDDLVVIPANAGIQCLSTNDAGSPPARGRRREVLLPIGLDNGRTT